MMPETLVFYVSIEMDLRLGLQFSHNLRPVERYIIAFQERSFDGPKFRILLSSLGLPSVSGTFTDNTVFLKCSSVRKIA